MEIYTGDGLRTRFVDFVHDLFYCFKVRLKHFRRPLQIQSSRDVKKAGQNEIIVSFRTQRDPHRNEPNDEIEVAEQTIAYSSNTLRRYSRACLTQKLLSIVKQITCTIINGIPEIVRDLFLRYLH